MIYVIARGSTSRGPLNIAQKRHAREVLTNTLGRRNYESAKRRPPPLTFNDKDMDMSIFPNHDYPLLVKAFINNKQVHWLLVDIGSTADIMFYDFFKNLRILQSELLPYKEDLIGFSSHHITLIGYVKLHETFGKTTITRTIIIRFIVV